ncbi:MAG: hypothetical protein DRG76_03370 [Deltaproteobacteria bacterium]|nr:MAG: hypothetical protein DRG76_03370 [Deltaproteobacteria bacterium]
MAKRFLVAYVPRNDIIGLCIQTEPSPILIREHTVFQSPNILEKPFYFIPRADTLFWFLFQLTKHLALYIIYETNFSNMK